MVGLLLDGMSVLVVEDHSDSRDAYALSLSQLGAAITIASNAVDAYALLCNGLRPSLILSDFHLPGMDGIAFLLSVRGELGLKIPLVAITGDVMAADRLIGAGFDACLVKPVLGRVVADAIARVLERAPETPIA
jgi:two-component system, chemotaxis family, chemotaxis protein CheY